MFSIVILIYHRQKPIDLISWHFFNLSEKFVISILFLEILLPNFFWQYFTFWKTNSASLHSTKINRWSFDYCIFQNNYLSIELNWRSSDFKPGVAVTLLLLSCTLVIRRPETNYFLNRTSENGRGKNKIVTEKFAHDSSPQHMKLRRN
jgi:hypothetical protein